MEKVVEKIKAYLHSKKVKFLYIFLRLRNGKELKFPMGMYNNFYGSIAVTYVQLRRLFTKVDMNRIWKKWEDVTSDTSLIDWGWDDPECVEKTLHFFGVSPKTIGLIDTALNVSRENCLMSACIDGHAYPLREDGMRARTLRKGIVYPIEDWEETITKIKDDLSHPEKSEE